MKNLPKGYRDCSVIQSICCYCSGLELPPDMGAGKQTIT